MTRFSRLVLSVITEEWLRQQPLSDFALAHVNFVLRLEPKNATALLYRAYALRNRGSHADAIRDLDEVLNLDPRCAFALTLRGQSQMALGRLEEAQANLEQSKIVPYNVDAWTSLTQCVRLAKDHDNGNDLDLTLRLSLSCAEGDPLYARGRIHMINGRFEEAVAYLLRSLNASPMSTNTLKMLAFCYKKLGRFREALVHADFMIKHCAVDWLALSIRAECKLGMNEYMDAIDDANRAFRMNPDSPVTQRVRNLCRDQIAAIALLDLGDHDGV